MPESGTRKMILPAKYVQGAGVLNQLGAHVKQYGERPFVVSGRTSFSKVKARVQASLLSAGIPLVGFDDSVSECTRAKIHEVSEKAQELDADVVIGCGGGKAVDTAKAVAEKLHVPSISVPTQCATNADGMADAVIFTEDHNFLEDFYLSRAPVLVLVDTEVVGRAPPQYIVQGMGDALACAFEKPAYAESQRAKRATDQATTAALEVNLSCFQTLMAHGLQAKKDVEAGKITEAVEAVVEAIKLKSGFGFGGGGCAAAHAVHNGLTVVPGIARKHGEIVAFGTLVQMILERRPLGEIERVMRWCKSVGLPVRLQDLGKLDRSHLSLASEKACDPQDSMASMPFLVTPKMVLDAIEEIDRLGAALS
ncbi:MAG: glycerol dehydrogenase [Thermoplasmata archaeon]